MTMIGSFLHNLLLLKYIPAYEPLCFYIFSHTPLKLEYVHCPFQLVINEVLVMDQVASLISLVR